MEWFRINDEGQIELNAEEVKLVPEVQELLTLKYNKGKTDHDGRKRYRAFTEFKYLLLLYSSKSPYKDYSEEERLEEAKKDCGFPADWKESPELKALIPKFVKGNKSKTERLLGTVEKFLEKFEKHLNSIELNERTGAGGMVHDPAKVMTTLRQLPGLAATIQELEQQVKLGHIGSPKSKGDHELGWMAINKENNGKQRTEEQEELV